MASYHRANETSACGFGRGAHRGHATPTIRLSLRTPLSVQLRLGRLCVAWQSGELCAVRQAVRCWPYAATAGRYWAWSALRMATAIRGHRGPPGLCRSSIVSAIRVAKGLSHPHLELQRGLLHRGSSQQTVGALAAAAGSRPADHGTQTARHTGCYSGVHGMSARLLASWVGSEGCPAGAGQCSSQPMALEGASGCTGGVASHGRARHHA